MIKLDIINEVVNRTGITKTKAEMAVETVFEAWRALERGRVVAIVGWLNATLVFMNRFMPRGAVRWMMGTIAKPPSHPATLL